MFDYFIHSLYTVINTQRGMPHLKITNNTGCTRANNFRVETVKYLIYSIVIFIYIEGVLTNPWCWIISFGDQRNISSLQTRNKSIGIDSAASSRVQGKYMKHVSFSGPPLETAMPNLNLSTFL